MPRKNLQLCTVVFWIKPPKQDQQESTAEKSPIVECYILYNNSDIIPIGLISFSIRKYFLTKKIFISLCICRIAILRFPICNFGYLLALTYQKDPISLNYELLNSTTITTINIKSRRSALKLILLTFER